MAAMRIKTWRMRSCGLEMPSEYSRVKIWSGLINSPITMELMRSELQQLVRHTTAATFVPTSAGWYTVPVDVYARILYCTYVCIKLLYMYTQTHGHIYTHNTHKQAHIHTRT